MRLWISKFLFLFITIFFTLFSSFVIGKEAFVGQQIISLGHYAVFPDMITLSGFTSGAGFATQLQISYSSLFSGVAVFQHGFYRCGPGDGRIPSYDRYCTRLLGTPNEGLDRPENSLQDIRNYFKMGIIENPHNLRNKKLYIYSGTENYIHSPDLSMKLLNIYEPFILNSAAIMTRVQSSNLTMPTNGFGGACNRDAVASFYLSNCGLSGPYEALKFLLRDNFAIRAPIKNEQILLTPLQVFDQTEFTNHLQGEHHLDKIGFLYIPTRCTPKTKCLLHFYFHGCMSGREYVGENHIRNSGFLEVAEINGIIMVFPQIVTSNGKNELGCWDTYGRTGKLYATQRGVQIIAVRSMIARILGEDLSYRESPIDLF